jgi:hypothetical protein
MREYPYTYATVGGLYIATKVYIISYHTIGRYLALPTGSIRGGQNSPYFDNYMQEGKYGPGNMTFHICPCFISKLIQATAAVTDF